MVFQPSVGEELQINGITYTIGEHPIAPHIPYGQEGRQGIVYQLVPTKETASSWKAIKVFRDQYKDPKQVYISEKLGENAKLPGLLVCDRHVLTPQAHSALLSKHRDLMYAVVMPWIEGPTWMDVILDKRVLTRSESLLLARSLAKVLSAMEQQGLAHCDLSGPNILLPRLVKDSIEDGFSYVELVDVEQMYAPRMERPHVVFGASPGYSPTQASETALWSQYADRFAGAILLAEMLGWSDPTIRKNAWGESYFMPEEIPTSEQRYPLLLSSIRNNWGEEVATLIDRAWLSQELNQCPTFGEWLIALMDLDEEKPLKPVRKEPKPIIKAAEPVAPIVPTQPEQLNKAVEPVQTEREHLKPSAASNQEPRFAQYAKNAHELKTSQFSLGFYYENVEKAKQFEEQGKWESALAVYEAIQINLPPTNALSQDLHMIISELETRIAAKRLLEKEEEERRRAAMASQQVPKKSPMKAIIISSAAALLLVLVGGGILWASDQAKTREAIAQKEQQEKDRLAGLTLLNDKLNAERAQKIKMEEELKQKEIAAKALAEQQAKDALAAKLKAEADSKKAQEEANKRIATRKVVRKPVEKPQTQPAPQPKPVPKPQPAPKPAPKPVVKPSATPTPKQQNGQWGFVKYDNTGNMSVVIGYKYDHAGAFSEGLAVVKKNGKFGYVDTNGNLRIPIQYDWASAFSGGKATVKKDGKNITINERGQVVK
ncbi:WG repeat-containing protein [Brevibacillus daliensis]|uniref:WG repeat-containing protein n=1 Tax=Brevibacillus daliensis TaxID=2892995 RepID=UPI002714676B|nr:WG repeat-containing protein [Brevibacillus daliensis]